MYEYLEMNIPLKIIITLTLLFMSRSIFWLRIKETQNFTPSLNTWSQ